MLSRFYISDEGWQPTTALVQQEFSSPYHQLFLLEIRSQAYESQIAQLRQKTTQVDDLKAEIAELHERFGRNSNNSSKPPSSDTRQHEKLQWPWINGKGLICLLPDSS